MGLRKLVILDFTFTEYKVHHLYSQSGAENNIITQLLG